MTSCCSSESRTMKVRSRRIKIRPNPLKEVEAVDRGPKRFPFQTIPKEKTRMLARSQLIRIDDSSSLSDDSVLSDARIVEEETDPFVDFDRTIAYDINKTSTPLHNRTALPMAYSLSLGKEMSKTTPSPILSAERKALISTPTQAPRRVRKSLFSSTKVDDNLNDENTLRNGNDTNYRPTLFQKTPTATSTPIFKRIRKSLSSIKIEDLDSDSSIDAVKVYTTSTPVFERIGKPLLSSTKIEDKLDTDRLTNAAKLYRDRIKFDLSESQRDRVTSQLLHKNAICDTVVEEVE